MKKKKVDVIKLYNIWNSDSIKIGKELDEYYFEIGPFLTTNDIAEAVSLLMMENLNINNKIWNINIGEVNNYNIQPSKCLYWLSGGDFEWINGEYYKKNWHECELEFQEEFGIIVISIIKKSKTFGDIRNGFIKHLNIANLYNFAIEKEISY